MNKLAAPAEPVISADLGRSRLVRHLAQRIARHFSESGQAVSDKSLVIGIFGEWGSGKSWILEQLARYFQDEQHSRLEAKDKKASLILPVRFNPWRFEAEEHLIVPLLMTVHDVLFKAKIEDEAINGKLASAASYVLRSSLAFARAWKFKIGLPGIGDCEFNPDLGFKAMKEEQQSQAAAAATDLNSCYYDFENGLKEAVDGSLRLLFLVDDIDRCLPERAVQMLEAIKLFLDVPECVFVLGVDDEVVERGICHRYRDYNVAAGGRSNDLPPITGAEYLEKIVHLPVRLPLMSRQQFAAFLRHRHPALFGAGTTTKDDSAVDRNAAAGNDAEQLLLLFEAAVPPIPRKLVRAAELLEFLLGLAENFQPDRVLLARLVLLQLFAPEVFRHMRRTNHWLIQAWAELQRDCCQEGATGEVLNTSMIDQLVRARPEDASDPFSQIALKRKSLDANAWRVEEQPLLEKLLAAGRNRISFDPCKVLKGLLPENVPGNLENYFHLVGEQEEGPRNERLEPVSLPDWAVFVEELFSDREATWRKALDREQLRGKALDEKTFQEVQKKLQDDKERCKNLSWLEALSMRLTRQHRDWLDKSFGLRKALAERMANEALPILERAEAGRTLGRLGDRRPGVAVVFDKTGRMPKEHWHGKHKHNLPDIDWVQIPAAEGFMMGTDDTEGDDDERPSHGVELDAFGLGRYLVTNAQYRCFVEAGGYDCDDFWLALGAKDWRAGAVPDQSMLASLPEEHRKWLLEDTVRHQPRFWMDDQRSIANHPVVGVSWFEAVAFCRWLSLELGKEVRLPTEAEWEWAACGLQKLCYAWGNEFASHLGNTKETKLERTTAVGLFPPSQVFGLCDLTGNAWEWCYDWHAKNYYEECRNQGTVVNPQGSAKGARRVLRGGSYFNSPLYCRSVYRSRSWPVLRVDFVGFRLVLQGSAGG